MKNTILGINGYDVEIQTYKGNNGVLVCNAQFGKSQERNGYSTFSFAMYEDPNIKLAVSPPNTRATEKAIQTIHAAGLAKFEEMKAAGTLPKRDVITIQPGQVLVFFGPGMSEERNLVVYETDGKNHKTINLETLKLGINDHIRPIEKKFGIGTYYTQEVLPIEPILEAVERAKEKAAQDNQVKEEKATAAAEARKKAIEIGAATLSAIPAGMTHVIVAEKRVNKSDPMTDYFAHETEETHYLAFSRHDRNLFEEMRKAAANHPNPDVNKYATKPEEGKDHEHRENYSGGAGYYLGESKYSGWVIQKRTISKGGEYWGVKLEDLQIAIAENRYFIPTGEQETTTQELPSFGDIKVVDYSEKSIAVTGPTRPIKDTLRSLGGSWCGRGLNVPERQGWVFPKRNADKVINYLKTLQPA